jgi:hypothetical protein
MTTQEIKTQRIASGYYKGIYKNIEFIVQKVYDLPNSEIAWYWQIGNKTVNDWQSSKFSSIQAVKSYIDENTN